MLILCPQCKEWKPVGNERINRARKDGLKLYCGRVCAGLGRRKEAPVSPRNPNWKAMKKEYDNKYRQNNLTRIKSEKKAYYAKVGPKQRDKEKADRQKRMPQHVEYCRQPEYRKYKHGYDKRRRAVIQFGEFADSFLILQDIQSEILSRATRVEIGQQNGTINKSTQRKRDYERITGIKITRSSKA